MAVQPKPATRRARGTGSVFYHARRKLWVARTPVGRSPAGRTLYREASDPKQADAIAKLARLQPPAPACTVRDWCARWLDSLAVRPTTADAYANSVARHVNPVLGHLPVAGLTPAHVEAAARAWAAAGLAPNTVRQVLGHLCTAMAAAARAGLVARNPVALAKKPRGVKPDVRPFAPAELARIVAEAARRPPARVVALLAATGCRLGEALALEVTDWDGARVSITKTRHPKHGVGPTKSANGRRTVTVPAPARPALALAARGRSSGPLFLSGAGRSPNRAALHAAWGKLLGRLGLAYRNLHQLRHSVATHLIAAGVPLADVAAYLGDTVQTVVKTYLHPTGVDPAATLDALLHGRSVARRVVR